jgi:hypothetical protein
MEEDMIFSLDSGQYIYTIPHKADYDIWRSRLTNLQYKAIFDELNSRVDTSEIHTSSWIPGADWTNTVFQPIYEVACRYNDGAAAKFFGLILWHVILERDEVWTLGRYEKAGVPIEGMTYFILQNPPPR